MCKVELVTSTTTSKSASFKLPQLTNNLNQQARTHSQVFWTLRERWRQERNPLNRKPQVAFEGKHSSRYRTCCGQIITLLTSVSTRISTTIPSLRYYAYGTMHMDTAVTRHSRDIAHRKPQALSKGHSHNHRAPATTQVPRNVLPRSRMLECHTTEFS